MVSSHDSTLPLAVDVLANPAFQCQGQRLAYYIRYDTSGSAEPHGTLTAAQRWET
jgi:hypothetical protein